MSRGIVLVTLLVNAVALLCVLNPWFEGWADAGIALFTFEALFLVLVGLPVFVHHRRRGLPTRDAFGKSLDSVMSFLAGWV